MSKVGIICLVLGVLGFTAFLISITIVGYIDDRVNEECDTEIGTVGQIIGADEGQCQDARDSRNLIKSIQIPILSIGVISGVFGGILIFKD